ncbi:hypothetical protein JOM56_010835 [Amanita muscaria]
MVNIYVYNPSKKLGWLRKLLLEASKRVLKNIHNESAMGLTTAARPPKASIVFSPTSDHSFEFTKPAKAKGKPVRDPEYYKDESQGGFCIFQVENKLFRVHRFFLMREPSAFEDMLRFPSRRYNNNGSSDDNPVILSDREEQFRDLLWALYARPSDLQRLSDRREMPFLEKLLNIAEMSTKYCIVSFRTWSVQCIYALTKDANSPLRSAPTGMYARILAVAASSGCDRLLEYVTKKVATKILWHNMPPEPFIPVAERNELRKLQGICYYRQLTTMERETPYLSLSGSSQLAIPLSFNVEKRKRFFRAHSRLVELWEELRSTPPDVTIDGCPSHGLCMDTWTHLWREAGSSAEILRCGPADVLGRLKAFMVYLRHAINETPAINEPCTHSALQEIASVRDEIIEKLGMYFECL